MSTNVLLFLIAVSLFITCLVVIKRRIRRSRFRASEHLTIFDQAIAALPVEEYIPRSIVDEWRERHADAVSLAHENDLSRYLLKDHAARYRLHREHLRDLSTFVRSLNESFIERRLDEDIQALDRVEKYPLTERQRRAVVVDENNTFVVAGAGTGKTSTIIGKVDYITRRGLATPAEILVLAYGSKAAGELRDRFSSFQSAGAVEASTFHALGRRIIGNVEGKAPTLSIYAEDDRALGQFISNHLVDQLGDSAFAYNLIRLFSDLLDEEEDPAAHGAPSEVQRLRALGLRDLTDTRMKSRQEVAIANWLTLHGIKWEYEREYEHPTATPWRRPYQPDFYLSDYGIYLEHFGVDRNNQTAEHVDNQSYVQAMDWKQQLHKSQGTLLIQTYSWMFSEQIWVQELRRQLMACRVPIKPISPEEARALIDNSSKSLSDFVKLVAQFLSLYKSGGHTRDEVMRSAETERDRVFLDVFFRVYDAYDAELTSSGRIDFNDMINRARAYVQEGRFVSPYRYIVVDEFQDISANRLGLIQDLRRQQSHSRVFVVGDDWQSIYRFTGSDIGIVTKVEDHLGYTERIDLDIAFRYPQPLLDVTSRFVMKNPSQLKKTLRAHTGSNSELSVCVVFDEGRDSSQPIAKALDVVMHEIESRLGSTPSGAGETVSVMMIGRYHFNRPEKFEALKVQLARHQVRLEYSTAHAAKGKEADFVIVVGLEAGEYGFPSNVSDDHVMRMVLTDPDSYPYGEERRLFYVAMTRTRSRTYLVVPHDNVSPFVAEELLDESMAHYVEVVGEVSERHRCPRCGGRTIKRKMGSNGMFWGCSNWPICLGKLRTCPACKDGALEESEPGARCSSCGYVEVRCPRCREGMLVSRTNRRTGKEFWACSMWNGGAGCTHTQNHRPYLEETTVAEVGRRDLVGRR